MGSSLNLVSDQNVVFGVKQFRKALRSIRNEFEERHNKSDITDLSGYVDEVKRLYAKPSPLSDGNQRVDFLYKINGSVLEEKNDSEAIGLNIA